MRSVLAVFAAAEIAANLRGEVDGSGQFTDMATAVDRLADIDHLDEALDHFTAADVEIDDCSDEHADRR